MTPDEQRGFSMATDFNAEWEFVASNAECVIIRDVANPTKRSVTNDAENVVHDLRNVLRGRRLFYFDTMGVVDEILVNANGRFAGFAAGPSVNPITGAAWAREEGGR